MQIEVSARKLEMPGICACCGDPATDQLPVSSSRTKGKRVVRTETVVWHFPYCVQCIAHVHAVPGPPGGAAGVLFLLGLVCLLFEKTLAVMFMLVACGVGVVSLVVRRS